MTQVIFANVATTTLAGAITAGATSVNLATGTGALFPNPVGGQYFTLSFRDAATKLQREIARCTARAGDTLTITRAQEGTTAAAWQAGDLASNYLTAGALMALEQTNYSMLAFTAAGSFTFTTGPNTTQFRYRIWGAGGPGGNGNGGGGGGGSGGGYAEGVFNCAINTTYSGVVGAGGVPNTSNGGGSSIAGVASATGGQGGGLGPAGPGNTSFGGGSGGALNSLGESGSNGAAGGGLLYGGQGGNAFGYSGGSAQVVGSSGTATGNSAQVGSGGSGGAGYANGGAGGVGLVLVELLS